MQNDDDFEESTVHSSAPSVTYCPRMSFHCFCRVKERPCPRFSGQTHQHNGIRQLTPLFHLSQNELMPMSKPMLNANAPAKMEVT